MSVATAIGPVGEPTLVKCVTEFDDGGQPIGCDLATGGKQCSNVITDTCVPDSSGHCVCPPMSNRLIHFDVECDRNTPIAEVVLVRFAAPHRSIRLTLRRQ